MFIARRLLGIIPILLIVTLIVMVLLLITPGDPAAIIAGEFATPAEVARIRERLHLDDPLPQRYVQYLSRALQGDLGTSLITSQPVARSIMTAAPTTLSLALIAVILTVVLALPIGTAAALRPGGRMDRGLIAVSALALAIPTFVVGLFLVLFFAIERGWLPATDYASPDAGIGKWLSHLILPGFALALASAAELARQVRGSLLDTLSEDYIRTARAKGLRDVRILVRHAAKNAAIPVVTVLGLQISRIVGGTVTVETVFAMPGLGTLAYSAILHHDYPLIQGFVLIIAVFVTLTNLVVDLSYGYFNPRLRMY